MSLLRKILFIPESRGDTVSKTDLAEEGEARAIRIPREGWVRLKAPGLKLQAVDPVMGGIVRVLIRDGIPVVVEPISTIDDLSEADLSLPSPSQVKSRLFEV